MKRVSLFITAAVIAGLFGTVLPESSRADSTLKVISTKSFIALSSEQAEWTQHCPLCGGLPEYTFLKDAGTVWLMCHNCSNEWEFQRIKCAYCGTQNPDTLSYIYAENDGISSMRFYVCEACNRYIKMRDICATSANIATILQKSMINQFEWEVQNQGYQPGWLN